MVIKKLIFDRKFHNLLPLYLFNFKIALTLQFKRYRDMNDKTDQASEIVLILLSFLPSILLSLKI